MQFSCAAAQVHNGSISRLRMTWDETFLFSCGDDGSIFVFEIKDKDAAAAAAAAAPGQVRCSAAQEARAVRGRRCRQPLSTVCQHTHSIGLSFARIASMCAETHNLCLASQCLLLTGC